MARHYPGGCIKRTIKTDQWLFLVVMMVAYMVITMTACTLIGAVAEYGTNDFGYQEYCDTTPETDENFLDTKEKYLAEKFPGGMKDQAKEIFGSDTVRKSAAAGAGIGFIAALIRQARSVGYIGYTEDNGKLEFAAAARGKDAELDAKWDEIYEENQNRKNTEVLSGEEVKTKVFHMETDEGKGKKGKLMTVKGVMWGATVRGKASFISYAVITVLFAMLMAVFYNGILSYHQVMGALSISGVFGLGYTVYLAACYSPTVARTLKLDEAAKCVGNGVWKGLKAVGNLDLVVSVGDCVASGARYAWVCTETCASAIGDGACALGEGVCCVGSAIGQGLGAVFDNRRRRLKSVHKQSNDCKTSTIMRSLEDAIRQN